MRKPRTVIVFLLLTALLFAFAGTAAAQVEGIPFLPINLTPDSGPAGSQVTIKITDINVGTEGFESVTLTWSPAEICAIGFCPDESQYLGEGTTDENGLFEYEFTVPDVPPGNYFVGAFITYTCDPAEDYGCMALAGTSASGAFHVTESSADPAPEFNRSNKPDPDAAGSPSGNRGGSNGNTRSMLPSTGLDFVGVGALLFLSLFTGLLSRRTLLGERN